MHIDNRSTLEKQHDDGELWDNDALLCSVIDLLRGQLNDDNYRKLTLDEVKEIITTRMQSFDTTPYERRAHRIIRALNKKKEVRDIMLYLGERILD